MAGHLPHYAVTFGGFIGLTTFLPSYYYDQFGVGKIQAGQLTMLAAQGAALRIFGGWISDHWGGINTLTAVCSSSLSRWCCADWQKTPWC